MVLSVCLSVSLSVADQGRIQSGHGSHNGRLIHLIFFFFTDKKCPDYTCPSEYKDGLGQVGKVGPDEGPTGLWALSSETWQL